MPPITVPPDPISMDDRPSICASGPRSNICPAKAEKSPPVNTDEHGPASQASAAMPILKKALSTMFAAMNWPPPLPVTAISDWLKISARSPTKTPAPPFVRSETGPADCTNSALSTSIGAVMASSETPDSSDCNPTASMLRPVKRRASIASDDPLCNATDPAKPTSVKDGEDSALVTKMAVSPARMEPGSPFSSSAVVKETAPPEGMAKKRRPICPAPAGPVPGAAAKSSAVVVPRAAISIAPVVMVPPVASAAMEPPLPGADIPESPPLPPKAASTAVLAPLPPMPGRPPVPLAVRVTIPPGESSIAPSVIESRAIVPPLP
ncbi:hypothetical protein NOLU111490_14870 [Novosphingobium lubricantis]